jgi:hypothetical protein
MARRNHDETLRDEFKRQLRGFPREFKRQLTGFGREAVHQLGSGWGEKFARQIFGGSRRTGRRSR